MIQKSFENWAKEEKNPLSLSLPRLFLVPFFPPYPNLLYFHFYWFLKSEKLMEVKVEHLFLCFWETKTVSNGIGSRRNCDTLEIYGVLESHSRGVGFILCHIITIYLEQFSWSLWASISHLVKENQHLRGLGYVFNEITWHLDVYKIPSLEDANWLRVRALEFKYHLWNSPVR